MTTGARRVKQTRIVPRPAGNGRDMVKWRSARLKKKCRELVNNDLLNAEPDALGWMPVYTQDILKRSALL